MSFLCFVLLAFIHTSGAGDSFSMEVAPRSEECIYEDLEKGDAVEYEHHVISGGMLDISIRLYYRTMLFHHMTYTEGKMSSIFAFDVAETGPHAFCFDNRMSRFTPKQLMFSLKISRISRSSPSQQKVDVSSLEDSIKDISLGLETVEQEQDQYRLFKNLYQSTVETTHTHLSFWSVVEFLLLFLMCTLQVICLRRLFDPDTQSM
eukprot:TRINITY_DN2301_c1_g1_i4.p1 TRINITY_DN2301_c1_g1~~TRINITY_DN2301_c1_g1_i4.p1  ORF type:complete len:205 (-),score=23.33 TRINITY_DN2301_c1_g1_i4:98-712(-)